VEYDLMAPYARLAAGVPLVLTQHDAGTISFFHSYFREMAGWGKFARVGEWLRRVRFEREALARFDRVVVCTEPDARRLARVAAAERIRVVPTGVDLDEFAPGAAPATPTLVFVGHYPHFPNEDAAVFFARRVLPRVRQARPDVRFLAVGSSPTPAVMALGREPGVIVTGTVPSVAPFLRQAAVFVAPLRLGQGIKGKILEAFAAGVPVVATPCAADGLGARAGVELELASSPRAFASVVAALLSDEGRRRRLGEAGRAFARRAWSWPALAPRLGGVYEELVGREART
jgi:glycosyltransferase involved in cell wall biosynthesis